MSDVFAVLTLRDGTRVSLPDDDVVIFSGHPSYPYTTVYRLSVLDSHVKAGNPLVLNPNPCNASEKLALVGYEDLRTVLRFAKAMQ